MDYDETFHIETLEDEIAHYHKTRIIQQTVFTIFFAIGICADVIMIYTIFRFRRLRSISNTFLANWAIADLCCLLVTPSGYRILTHLAHSHLPDGLWCFLNEAGATLHMTAIISAFVVTLDWFLGAYFGSASETFRNNYKFVIGTVWLFTIAWATTFTGLCISESYGYIHQGVFICLVYGITLLMVIICQISRLIQKFRKMSFDYPVFLLPLPTTFVICIFLSVITLYMSDYLALNIIATCIMFSSSVVNLNLMYHLDEDFHACFRQLLKRSESKYEGFDNPIRNVDPNDSIKISFNSNTEELLSSLNEE